MKMLHFLTCVIILPCASLFASAKAESKKNTTTDNQVFNKSATWELAKKNHSLYSHMFTNASLIYWFAGEEGLSLAESGVLVEGTLYFSQNTQTILQKTRGAPGIKTGTGIVLQNEWVLSTEMTSFYTASNTKSGGLPDDVLPAGTIVTAPGAPIWVVNDWFLQGTGAGQALAGPTFSSRWRLCLNLLDFNIAHPFYEGRCLIVNPFSGLRIAVINQSLTFSLVESTGLINITPPPGRIYSRNKSRSWGIGPRFGTEVEWLLGSFRLESGMAGSLLYTQYKVLHSEDPASITFNPGPYKACQYSQCLRPIAEASLGLGWGCYYLDQLYHIDVVTKYDFAYYWAQNKMRKLLDDILTGTGPAPADLFIHGLTLTFRFDF